MKFLIDGIEVEGELTEIIPHALTEEDRRNRVGRYSLVMHLTPPVKVFSLMLSHEDCNAKPK
jgi:hypothetical protein